MASPRLGVPDDLPAVEALFNQALGVGYVPRGDLDDLVATSSLAVTYRRGTLAGALTWALTPAPGPLLDGFSPVLVGAGPVGVIKSGAVFPAERGRGVMSGLLAYAEQRVAREGAVSLATVSWASGSTQASASLLERSGWRLVAEVEDLWRADSLDHGYECPTCGSPCRCTGLLFVK